jgi:hypothetical protein
MSVVVKQMIYFFIIFFESFSAVVGTKEDMHSLNQIYFDIKFY